MTTENMPEKSKALTSAISELEKRYGRGAIMNLGTASGDRIEAYSTGSLGLDIALGIGGIPRGRICEIYGPESSGKTTLALHMAAEVQKKGGTVVFIDAEHALDVNYAKKLGVDTSKLLVSQPDCGEQALEICDTLIQTGSVDLVIVDSVAALVPRAEIDGEMDDQQPGMQARLMSKALRKMTAVAAKSNCSILFINQIRMKIGVMFGSPETTAGGNALKFYASVRMDVRRIGSIKDQTNEDADVTGNRVRVKVVKNKVAPPFREAEFDVIFNEGICRFGELLDIGVEKGVLDKAGAWYSFRGERLGQGRDGSKTFLKEHPEITNEIRTLVLETLGISFGSSAQSNGSKTDLQIAAASAGKPEKEEAQSKADLKKAQLDKFKAKKKAELNGSAASA
ncbi:MAG: recombinase RecA [Deltaproteobacteria bacterium]|nr:recombinase RecA [Deltaproteobacteria bacterium]